MRSDDAHVLGKSDFAHIFSSVTANRHFPYTRSYWEVKRRLINVVRIFIKSALHHSPEFRLIFAFSEALLLIAISFKLKFTRLLCACGDIEWDGVVKLSEWHQTTSLTGRCRHHRFDRVVRRNKAGLIFHHRNISPTKKIIIFTWLRTYFAA